MAAKRIVSLLPSATELIYELGASDLLYGVTHECNYPEDAQSKPRVIRSIVDSANLTSKEIDEKISKLAKDGKDIYKLDKENMKKAAPDLIISQLICEVCSAHTNQVNQALEIARTKPRIYSYDPHNIGDVLKTVEDIADLIGQRERGKKLKEHLLTKINTIQARNYEIKPNVLALEWLEPFYSIGHWVPEMIQISGGKSVLGHPGEHSFRIPFSKVLDTDPDIIILMPCGFDTKRTKIEYDKTLRGNEDWQKIRAVQEGNVFAVNANAYFSKPSIRIITGIEILNKIIQPEKFEGNLPSESYEQLT